jgi:hypothetical protein
MVGSRSARQSSASKNDTSLKPQYLLSPPAAGKAQIVDNFVALWFTLAFERGWGRNLGLKLLAR